MTRSWLRRALQWAVAASSLALLGACGSGTIESQLVPKRIVAFGDGTADLGQTSNASVTNARYTINDNSVNVWTHEVAVDFGITVTTAALGGTSYATGNARVTAKPDAAGNAATPTVQDQVGTFLASGVFADTDLVLVSAGTADVVAELAKFVAGTQTNDQMLANIGQAGRDLGAQVRRLVTAGAKQVVVVGPYNLAKSPYAQAANQTTAANAASARFNEELLVSIVDLGAHVLYVDAAFFFNLVTSSPSTYGFTNATAAACTSVDAGPGIGLGAGQVNSALCTSATLLSGINPAGYVFADKIYLSPQSHRVFGDTVYQRVRARW